MLHATVPVRPFVALCPRSKGWWRLGPAQRGDGELGQVL